MATRDEIFEELGLTPVFVRKGAAKRVASQKSAPDAVVSKATAEVAIPSAEIKASPLAAAPTRAPAVAAAAEVVAVAKITPSTESETARAERIAGLNWEELVADIANCTACALCQTRTKTVPGSGARAASWMVIGEAPGADEDEQGEPFIGRSGKLLDAMLRSVKKSRDENVFIVNTLKCRPPENRNPAPHELAACAPYLKRQLALTKPKLILAVGEFAAQSVAGTDEGIGAMRGRTFHYEGTPVRVTYHPAYLLRSPLNKAKAWDDLLAAQKLE